MGVKPDDFIAIIADKSIEVIAGIYGIMKAGGAYVPIDPTYPAERIAYMLEDCAPKAVLRYTTESININSEIPVIDLSSSEVWEGASENPEIVNKPEDLLYCIYTSGLACVDAWGLSSTSGLRWDRCRKHCARS